MTGVVQIASDMSARFHPERTQILLSRVFFTRISDEKPQLLSSHAAGQWQSFQLQGGLFRGRRALRPLYFSSVPGLRWADSVRPRPFPPRVIHCQRLWNETAFFLPVVTRLLPASFLDTRC